MKKTGIRALCVLMSAVLCIGTFSACTKDDEKAVSVDNTGANTVAAYNTADADFELTVDTKDKIHDISDLLFGIFLEDISFAADGGLYAEMVANRSFEFTELAVDDALYRWSAVGNADISVESEKEHSLNENNPSYLVMKNSSTDFAGIENQGFLDGMSIEEGKNYNMTFYAKSSSYDGEYQINLAVNGEAVTGAKVTPTSDEWTKYSVTLTSPVTAYENVTLQVIMNKGEAYFDMISLFPENTYKNRENGLRNDLATKLENLEPAFLRFPGGCVIEGYDANSAYDWKDSIGVDADGNPLKFGGTYGDVAARKMGTNIWTDINATDDPYPSFMTYGLGFYEYFLLAEDIGAVGVPVLNCGLYCQGRNGEAVRIFNDDKTYTDEFQKYLDNMTDLVEFCRGDENTKWGKVRIAMGHQEPFELRYICIGNENFDEVYYERYSEFLKVFKEEKAENPELYNGIELIYSSGTDDGDNPVVYAPSYEYAQSQLGKMNSNDASDFAGATDQHYYNTPIWFLKHANYYDEENYSRNVDDMTSTRYGGAIPVFLGEYAAQSNTLNAALSEAAYMTGLERNGDIVAMAAYAPLFASATASHWSPNLIWFNNHQSMSSVNYYVQQLFSKNQGTEIVKHNLTGAELEPTLKGAIGVGTWYTSASFDNVSVVSNETGEALAQEDFNSLFAKSGWEFPKGGKWKIKDKALTYTSTEMEYADVGTVAYFGDSEWDNYTYTVEATKLDGEEGFLIPIGVKDVDNNVFWNIGGWGNTVSTLQQVECGVKDGRIESTVKDCVIETGKTYELKVEVNGEKVKCYIDGELYVDYDFSTQKRSQCYSVVSTDDNGDIIIKLVNVTDSAKTTAVKLDNANVQGEAVINQVSGESLEAENALGQKEICTLEEFTLNGFAEEFNYTMPAYSVTSIRLKAK
ncbi:MAG: alpha-L-arabinofuranosidase C-terminal domain-containing protein [Eubacterium sp.]